MPSRRYRIATGLATPTRPSAVDRTNVDELVEEIVAVTRHLAELLARVPDELSEEVRARCDAEFARGGRLADS